jgi:DNA-binding response OmpR family regulator
MAIAISGSLNGLLPGPEWGDNPVRKPIVVLDPDEKHSVQLCSMLEKEEYHPIPFSSWSELASGPEEDSPSALIVNIDLVPLDNQTLRGLRRENPELCIIGLSSRSFHPELKEALSRYVDACFAKPVEWDDLLYYLKGTLRDSQEKTLPPAGGMDEKRP